MMILGLETSTSMASLGVVSEDETLAELKVDLKAEYSRKLMSAIDCLLTSVSLDPNELSGLSISIGPGSFTGLRVGLATIKGLAYSLGKPIVAIPSLDAIAWRFGYLSCVIASIIDAKKEEIYVALYQKRKDNLERISPYLVLPPQGLSKIITRKTLFVGPGVGAFRKRISESLKDKALFLSEEICYVSGEAIARMGMRKLLRGEFENIGKLEPLYVRESDAQLENQKAKS